MLYVVFGHWSSCSCYWSDWVKISSPTHELIQTRANDLWVWKSPNRPPAYTCLLHFPQCFCLTCLPPRHLFNSPLWGLTVWKPLPRPCFNQTCRCIQVKLTSLHLLNLLQLWWTDVMSICTINSALDVNETLFVSTTRSRRVEGNRNESNDFKRRFFCFHHSDALKPKLWPEAQELKPESEQTAEAGKGPTVDSSITKACRLFATGSVLSHTTTAG